MARNIFQQHEDRIAAQEAKMPARIRARMSPVTPRAAKKAERAAHVARMDALHAEARQIVASGKCPDCGAALRRNLALAGWWQCTQYGAEGFRADSSKPSCSFQTFTE